jgi:hypothetical protein
VKLSTAEDDLAGLRHRRSADFISFHNVASFHRYSPKWPFTESSSFLVSYPAPSLNSISTLSMSSIRVARSP